MWQIEFNKRNYPNVYFDFRLRNNIEAYTLDTNVILHPRKELWEFLDKARVTLYPVTLSEIFSLRRYFEKRYFEKCRNLLNRENIRIVQYVIPRYDEEFREEIKRGIIDKNDAIFLTYAKLENTCVISFDKGVNEVAFRHDINVWDTRVINRLPKKDEIEFSGSWKERKSLRDKKATNLKI